MLGRVTIIGCGLIGGSLLKGLRARQVASRLAAVDRDDVVELARPYVDVAATVGTAEATRLVAESDLVVLATPVGSIVQDLGWALDSLAPDAVVTDTGSIKTPMSDVAARHPKGAQFVGGHPMAGREIGGFAASIATLFEATRWFIVESAANAAPHVARVHELVRAVSAEPVVIDAKAHDRAMAYVSHVPQLVASALYDVAARAGATSAAGQGFRDMTRIAGGPPGIWRDILEGNRDAVAAALDDLLEPLILLRDAFAQEKGATLSPAFELLERAQAAKGSQVPSP
ncbi:MAG: prephenate dehydrogenase/arogenate dehydrogenase family protein [Polyangiaceae bacterium]